MSSTNTKERLSADIIEELERLGCEISSPQGVPDPRYLSFGQQRVAVPEAYRQFVEDVQWPDAELRGQMEDGSKYWGLRFFNDLQPFCPAELGYDYAGMDEVHFLHIGWMDSGNWLLLLRLDESDPTSPRWYSIDHDPYQQRPLASERFVEILRCLQGAGKADQIDEYIYALKSDDEHKIGPALTALKNLGPEAAPAIPALLESLDEPRYNYHSREVVRTLGEIGVASDAVIDGICSQFRVVPMWAVEALVKMSAAEDKVIPALVKLFEVESDKFAANATVWKARYEAEKLFKRYGERARGAVPALLALFEGTVVDGGMRCIPEIVAEISPEFDVLPAVWFERLADPETHRKVRIECAAVLLRTMRAEQQGAVLEAVLNLLRDEEEDLVVQGGVAEYLLVEQVDSWTSTLRFSERSEEVIEALVSLLDRVDEILQEDTRGDSPHVQIVTVLARLGALSAQDARPFLQRMIESDRRERRQRAAAVATSLGEDAWPYIEHMMRSLGSSYADDTLVPGLIELCDTFPDFIDPVADAARYDEEWKNYRNLELSKQRGNALRVLGGLGGKAISALSVVDEALSCSTYRITNPARDAIRAILQDSPHLWLDILDDPTYHFESRAACALAQADNLADRDRERFFGSLIKILTDEDETPELQAKLAECLVSKSETPLWEHTFRKNDPVVHKVASRLPERRDETIEVLESLLERSDLEIRMVAVSLLAGLDALPVEKALPVIEKLLQEDFDHGRKTSVATQVAVFLGEDARPIIPALIADLGDNFCSKTIPALVALYEHVPEVFDMVVEAIRPDFPCEGKDYRIKNRRAHALYALPNFGDRAQEVLPMAQEYLDDDLAEVRSAAEKVVQRLTDES